jgi:hypothetical protein
MTNNSVVKGVQNALGAYGFTYIGGTDATTGEWFAIQIVEDAVFALLTADNEAVITGDITSQTFPAGMILYCACSAITLTSGVVIAYKR